VKRNIIWLAIFTLAFFVGVHMYATHLSSYEETVGRTLKSLQENDPTLFYESVHITPSNEKEADRFFRYVQTSNMKQMEKDMKQAATDVLKSERLPIIIMHEDGTPLFVISKKKRLGLYDYAAIELPADIISVLIGPMSDQDTTIRLERSVIEKRALVSFTVKDEETEKTLYITRTPSEKEEATHGQIDFYLIGEDEETGILQPSFVTGERVFLFDQPEQHFLTLYLKDGTALLYQGEEEIELLSVYQHDEMHDVSIEGDAYMERLKQKDEETVEGYMYHEQNDVHYFSTWHWNPIRRHFELEEEKVFQKGSDTWPEDKQQISRWLEEEDYFIQ